MSVKTYTAPNRAKCWEDINFKTAEAHVKKLQKRIATAYLNNDKDKVTVLQHTLIHSFYAKALAVKCVSSNHGKNTPGIDGIIWATNKDKFSAIFDLHRRGYRPKPYKRMCVTKNNGRSRVIDIPTMKDRAMQTLYKFVLDPIAETMADRNSFAYRKRQSCRDAILRCGDILSTYSHLEWILKTDIKSCFSSINHEWILEHIPLDNTVLRKFLECGYVNNASVVCPIERGIPLGGCLSNTICNMVLDGMENMLSVRFHDTVHLVRYADDFIVVGYSHSFLVQDVVPEIEKFLSKRGLILSQEKTKITHAKNGVAFLGWNLYKERNKIICVPLRKSINSLLERIATVLNKRLCFSYEELGKSLKQIIRGWLNFYKLSTHPILAEIEAEAVLLTYALSKDDKLAGFVGKEFSRYIK